MVQGVVLPRWWVGHAREAPRSVTLAVVRGFADGLMCAIQIRGGCWEVAYFFGFLVLLSLRAASLSVALTKGSTTCDY